MTCFVPVHVRYHGVAFAHVHVSGVAATASLRGIATAMVLEPFVPL